MMNTTDINETVPRARSFCCSVESVRYLPLALGLLLTQQKMVDIMVRESSACDLKGLFQKFIPETIGRFLEAECQGIYPLKDCYIRCVAWWLRYCLIDRKAKILKRPKFEPYKLQELHSAHLTQPAEDTGKPVEVATEPAKEIIGGTEKK